MNGPLKCSFKSCRQALMVAGQAYLASAWVDEDTADGQAAFGQPLLGLTNGLGQPRGVHPIEAAHCSQLFDFCAFMLWKYLRYCFHAS